MKHANGMLDFIVNDITENQIKTATVTIGGTTYQPYKTKTSPVEYLLIVPVTTEATAEVHNPIIEITTNYGSIYKQKIQLIGAKNNKKVITNYTENTCYCFTLRGLELLLSPITVTDWSTGEAVAGDYIAVTAYPTFRGTPNTTYYVYYDNCLKNENGSAKIQVIKFNSRGECTLKPDGRIITHIFKDNAADKIPTDTNKLTTPITLGAMVIDLTEAINAL